MTKQKNIFLIGPMGAGKSAIGRQLAHELKVPFHDSDEVIEQRTGADISWIFDVEGEAGFRKREAAVIEDLTAHQGIVLATGGGAILLPENRARLMSRGMVIYLSVSIEEQLQRTGKDYRKRRPLLAVEDQREKLLEIQQVREPLYQELADVVINTDTRNVRSVVKMILKRLASDKCE